MNPRTAVIIPTHNRASLLDELFDSLGKQTLPPEEFEIVLVDNASTDGTQEACRAWSARLPNLRYVREDRPGLHQGRHAGMHAARPELLVFIDDDVIVPPQWLDGHLASFEDPKVMLAGGNVIPRFEGLLPSWGQDLWQKAPLGLLNPWYSLIDFQSTKGEVPYWAVFGCNFAIRRTALLGAGGFHPDGFPRSLMRLRGDGETAVARAVALSGARIAFHPAAWVQHRVQQSRLTLDYLHHRALLNGISASYQSLRAIGSYRSVQHHRILLRRRLGQVYRSIMHLIAPSSVVYPVIAEGWERGFVFHQREARVDRELMAWVCRQSYLDECPSPSTTATE